MILEIFLMGSTIAAFCRSLAGTEYISIGFRQINLS
jgi:hypothetical protein